MMSWEEYSVRVMSQVQNNNVSMDPGCLEGMSIGYKVGVVLLWYKCLSPTDGSWPPEKRYRVTQGGCRGAIRRLGIR